METERIETHVHLGVDLMPPSVAQAWFAVTPAVVNKYRTEVEGQKARTQNGEPKSNDLVR